MGRISDWLHNELFNDSPKLPEATGVVWDMKDHNGWGDSINWFDFERRRIHGHIGGLFSPRVQIGDEVRSAMASGKVARFIVTEVEHMRDPLDQFFATVAELDYLDQLPTTDTNERKGE